MNASNSKHMNKLHNWADNRVLILRKQMIPSKMSINIITHLHPKSMILHYESMKFCEQNSDRVIRSSH